MVASRREFFEEVLRALPRCLVLLPELENRIFLFLGSDFIARQSWAVGFLITHTTDTKISITSFKLFPREQNIIYILVAWPSGCRSIAGRLSGFIKFFLVFDFFVTIQKKNWWKNAKKSNLSLIEILIQISVN